MKRKLLITLLLVFMLTACSNERDTRLSVKEIISNAIEEYEKIEDYHAELEVFYYENGHIYEDASMKYWVSSMDGKEKVRLEEISNTRRSMIITSDGVRFIKYDKEINWAYISDSSNGISNYTAYSKDILGMTFKNQTINKLRSLLDNDSDLENLGEEEIDGIETYHLKGTIKNQEEVVAAQEFWIDKETWYVVKDTWSLVKKVPIAKGDKTEIKVISLNDLQETSQSLFTQEIASDTHIVDLDELVVKHQVIGLEEAIQNIGKNLLHLPQSLGYQVEIIEHIQNSKTQGRDYRLIQEARKDGISKFNIFITKSEGEESQVGLYYDEEESDIKEIDIRGSNAYFLDKSMPRIIFQENGIRYSFQIEDKNMKMEEAIEIIEKMTYGS